MLRNSGFSRASFRLERFGKAYPLQWHDNIGFSGPTPPCFNLENAVGREKDMQDIDVHSETKKLVVTLLVMRGFLVLPGASRACMDFRDPTAFSRFHSTSHGICVFNCIDTA